MNIFKIKDSKTGLYSVGGRHPEFKKEGKVYKKFSHLSSHLTLEDYLDKRLEHSGIENLVIEEYELTLVKTTPLINIIVDKKIEYQKQYEKLNSQREQIKREDEIKELKRLQEKYKNECI